MDIEVLIEQLRDPTWVVSQEAARILVELGEPAVVQLIGELQGPNSEVQRRAATALGEIGGREAVEPLIRVVEEADDKLVVWCAVVALGKLGDSRAVPALLKALADEKVNAAAEALAQIGRPAVMPLISALSHPDRFVRMWAASAFGSIGDESAVDALVVALHDSDEWVRDSTAGSLGAIGGERVLNALIEALRDEFADVRATAAEALGEIGDSRALPALEALVRDDSRTYDFGPVSDFASEAIARIRGKGERIIGE